MSLRLLDANLNRLREGLRVLEDVTRFMLEDRGLTEEVKRLRHLVSEESVLLTRELLGSRRAQQDVGAFGQEALESMRPDLLSLITANCRRAEESLRVLEEFGKLPGGTVCLEWGRFKEMRFTLYEMERQLASAVMRRDKRSKIKGLYVIVDRELVKGRSVVEVTYQALMGGAKAIQLRDKHRNNNDLLVETEELKKVCAEFGAVFIINDYADLAMASKVDGIHVGQKDMPVPLVRSILAIDQLVGCSTATVEEAVQAETDGADYAAVGSIFPTTTKEDTRLAGIETLHQVAKTVSEPVVAIGGINEDNVVEVIEAGADAVAVISAVVGADDVKGAAKRLVTRIETVKGS